MRPRPRPRGAGPTSRRSTVSSFRCGRFPKRWPSGACPAPGGSPLAVALSAAALPGARPDRGGQGAGFGWRAPRRVRPRSGGTPGRRAFRGRPRPGRAPRRRASRGRRRGNLSRACHGRTNGRRSANRRAPMPRTSRSSSTDRKPPLRVRWSMICRARTGPTPGRVSSCSAVAVLRLTGPVAAARRGHGERCCRGSRDGARDAHHHVLAVDEYPCPVEGGHVRTRSDTARRAERVHHPRPERQPQHAGAQHFAAHIDDDHRRRRPRCLPVGARGARLPCFHRGGGAVGRCLRRRGGHRRRLCAGGPSVAHDIRGAHHLRASGQEVPPREHDAQQEDDRERSQCPAFHAAPAPQPQRQPFPHGQPPPLPPSQRGRGLLGGCRRLGGVRRERGLAATGRARPETGPGVRTAGRWRQWGAAPRRQRTAANPRRRTAARLRQRTATNPRRPSVHRQGRRTSAQPTAAPRRHRAAARRGHRRQTRHRRHRTMAHRRRRSAAQQRRPLPHRQQQRTRGGRTADRRLWAGGRQRLWRSGMRRLWAGATRRLWEGGKRRGVPGQQGVGSRPKCSRGAEESVPGFRARRVPQGRARGREPGGGRVRGRRCPGPAPGRWSPRGHGVGPRCRAGARCGVGPRCGMGPRCRVGPRWGRRRSRVRYGG